MTVASFRRDGAVRTRFVALMALATLMALGFGFGAAQAQDDAVVTHPAHIHVGSCGPELDPNPAAPLNNIAPRGFDVEAGEFGDTMPEARGALNVAPVEVSESTAEIGFDEILETEHAINVHESDQNVQNYIACGNIGGSVFDDQLYILLAEENDSGYFGVAILSPDGDNTNVTVYLGRAVTGAEEPTPEAETDEVGDDTATPEA